MKKIDNFLFSEAKGAVKEYVAMMERRYNEVKQEYTDYMNAIYDDDPRFMWFNPDRALKFLRTWRILMDEADPRDRNFVLVYLYCDTQYDKALEIFNGAGCSYKSTASLKILIWAARNNVRALYEKKYGKTKGEDIL